MALRVPMEQPSGYRLWVVLECLNPLCEARWKDPRQGPNHWPISDLEAADPKNTDHLCPACGFAGNPVDQGRS